MNFETVIGLEVHVELNTNSKIFSPTSAHFGNEQNANTNVIDWSFPGVLPVMNKGVIDAGIKAALALNMDIHQNMHFDRKTISILIIQKLTKFHNLMSQLATMVGLKLSLKMGQLKKFVSNVLIWKKMLVKTLTVLMVILMLTLTVKVYR